MSETKFIYQNIQESDAVLNPIIEAYIAGSFYFGSATTATEWRLENYNLLRGWAYPSVTEYNDAQVKLNSGVPELALEGQIQLDRYIQDCLAVKLRFPKE